MRLRSAEIRLVRVFLAAVFPAAVSLVVLCPAEACPVEVRPVAGPAMVCAVSESSAVVGPRLWARPGFLRAPEKLMTLGRMTAPECSVMRIWPVSLHPSHERGVAWRQ